MYWPSFVLIFIHLCRQFSITSMLGHIYDGKFWLSASNFDVDQILMQSVKNLTYSIKYLMPGVIIDAERQILRLTSNKDFWNQNTFATLQHFDCMHQKLTTNVKYWSLTSNIWWRTSNIWWSTSDIWLSRSKFDIRQNLTPRLNLTS